MKKSKYDSHYDYLDENFHIFLVNIGINRSKEDCSGQIIADGDKVYGYKDIFEEHGIHFYQGVALYLLTKLSPYDKEVRNTSNGWVAPCDWVISNYKRFKEFLPPI